MRNRGWAGATPGYHRRVRVLVHDRTEGVPSRLVDYAEQRLLRVGRHFDLVQEVEVEFADESHRGSAASCMVHITVRTDGRRHPVAHVTERATEARTALDLALDKVDRQVVKLKEKIKIERKRASHAVAGGDDDDGVETGSGELERVRMKLRPESVEDAAEALATADHPFYVFLDEGTGMVNVCYRRADGGLTVIEPVVP
ncbi:MAG: ribosome-associated translation inhibitor RaiA [Chloroflexi bacterium]|nr:MAG: ribosome-associated translation inhibitor RaiA [Chloroflexota bacterium]